MAIKHPCPNDQGEDVWIYNPHTADGRRVFTPGCQIPPYSGILNNIPFWECKSLLPETVEQLVNESDDDTFDFRTLRRVAAGMVLVEQDHQQVWHTWLISPTNQFANYRYTFPKGTHDCESLKHTAVKEVLEETGLFTLPIDLLGDYDRPTTRCRYYIGRRLGGSPPHMGWETQAVHLVTLDEAAELLHTEIDLRILADVRQYLKA